MDLNKKLEAHILEVLGEIKDLTDFNNLQSAESCEEVFEKTTRLIRSINNFKHRSTTEKYGPDAIEW